MRVFAGMPRWLPAGAFALALLLGIHPAFLPVAADTGSYRISDYAVSLEPQSSGSVRLTCEQEWTVLSGHIPWVTVGLPNADFAIEEHGGAVSRISAENSGGWAGVRVELDRDYLPGQTFRVRFAVLQEKLLERLTDERRWRIRYTPGWYDRAAIDRLQVRLLSPVPVQSYSSLDPQPAKIEEGVIIWERSNLQPGERSTIKIVCLDGSFLTATAGPAAGKKVGRGLLFVAIIAVPLLLIMRRMRRRQAEEADTQARIAEVERKMATNAASRKQIEKGFDEYVEKKGLEPDASGRYYDRQYGDYITPLIWAAIIRDHGRRHAAGVEGAASATRGRAAGSGCACACVSCACACACACAGGGAAGCSRKTLHECRSCSDTESETKKDARGRPVASACRAD